MMDLLFRMERNRKEAAKFSELAKTAQSPFLRGYYSRIASGTSPQWANGDLQGDAVAHPPPSLRDTRRDREDKTPSARGAP
jgi:hypothetical protein